MKNGFPAPNKELSAKTQNNHLTGKAPYKFESTSLQRRVSFELAPHGFGGRACAHRHDQLDRRLTPKGAAEWTGRLGDSLEFRSSLLRHFDRQRQTDWVPRMESVGKNRHKPSLRIGFSSRGTESSNPSPSSGESSELRTPALGARRLLL